MISPVKLSKENIVMLIRLFILFFFSSTLLHAIDGREVMKIVYEEANSHKNKTTNVKLSIIDSENNERIRFFKLITQISSDFNKSLIKFYEPANIKGTALLTHKNTVKNETSQWIYFPSFKSLKALSTEEKNQSFMGSDFAYSDIAGRQLDQDKHTLVKEDKEYYYIRSIPVDSKDPYSQIDIIISKKTKTPVKISFFNADKQLIKVLTNDKIVELNGSYEAMEITMTNALKQGKSILVKNNIDVKTPVSDNEVSIKSLK